MSDDADFAREISDRLSKTVAVVEATSTEQFYLWKEWSNESAWQEAGRTPFSKVSWEQMNPGFCQTIGRLGDMPVVISLAWNRIEGQLVLFWELTSQVQDYRMAEPWLKKMFGEKGWPTYDSGNRRAISDAMNFHNTMIAVSEATHKETNPND